MEREGGGGRGEKSNKGVGFFLILLLPPWCLFSRLFILVHYVRASDNFPKIIRLRNDIHCVVRIKLVYYIGYIKLWAGPNKW